MPLPSLPQTGACRCGRVTIRVTKPPMITCACHCTGCQKMSSSAFSLTTIFPADGFEVIGETVIGGIRGPQLDHNFCPHCMSWMFTRVTGMDFMVNVRPTMFDQAEWGRPFMETCTEEKLAFAETGAVRSFARFPEAGEYEELLEAYRAWVAA